MGLELKIEATSISTDGAYLYVRDITNWTSELHPKLHLFLYARRVVNIVDTSELSVGCNVNLIDGEWVISVSADGRIEILMYAYESALLSDVLPEGTIRWITGENLLMKVISGVWTEVTDSQEAVEAAEYTSSILNISVLQRAIHYKNTLMMKYITKVKDDLAHGEDQNELYYSRYALDYIDSLIKGAEYNFGLALYTIYYDILANLETIITTGKYK